MEESIMAETQEVLEEVQEETASEEPEIEIVDERPPQDRVPPRDTAASSPDWDIPDEEIEEYGGKVKDRLKRLKYERHEERRQKEEAQRLSEQAIRDAQVLHQDKKTLLELIDKGNRALFEVNQQKSDVELRAAEEEYRQAYEAGDTDRIIKAQSRLTDVQYDKKRFEELRPEEKAQESAQSSQPSPQQAAPPLPKIEPRTQEWLKSNEHWFGPGGNSKLTGYAMGVDDELFKQGYVRGSEAYFIEVDKQMREEFPNHPAFGGADETRSPAPRKSVVAPATRGGKPPKKVSLTGSQVTLAKKFGLTNEQYAKEVAKLNTGN
jgi:hypothetical protein